MRYTAYSRCQKDTEQLFSLRTWCCFILLIFMKLLKKQSNVFRACNQAQLLVMGLKGSTVPWKAGRLSGLLAVKTAQTELLHSPER